MTYSIAVTAGVNSGIRLLLLLILAVDANERFPLVHGPVLLRARGCAAAQEHGQSPLPNLRVKRLRLAGCEPPRTLMRMMPKGQAPENRRGPAGLCCCNCCR